jgi:hypothetical protein
MKEVFMQPPSSIYHGPMPRRSICLSAIVAVAALSAAAQGQPRKLCRPNTAEQAAAYQALARLRSAFEALTPTSDPAAVRAGLTALLRLPCFELAVENEQPPLLVDARAALVWWKDGGYSWLSSYLRPPGYEIVRDVVLPPQERPVLGSGRAELAPLLCPAGDNACARETAGWSMRAEAAFAGLALLVKHGGRPDLQVGVSATDREECAKRKSYAAWRHCMVDTAPRRAVLPVGAIRAPTRGWLFVRDTHGLCIGTSAYDLATGAAFAVESCQSESWRRAEPAEVVRSELGRLPVDALREAVWMLLVLPQAVELQAEAENVALPATLQPVIRGDEPAEAFGSIVAYHDRPLASWTLSDGARTIASGKIEWPSVDGAEQHAADLLGIAKAALAVGCPPAVPPPAPLAEERTERRRALEAELARLAAAPPGCPATSL